MQFRLGKGSGLFGAATTAAARRAGVIAAAPRLVAAVAAGALATGVAATVATAATFRLAATTVLDRLWLGVGVGFEAWLDALLEVALDEPFDALEQAVLVNADQ